MHKWIEAEPLLLKNVLKNTETNFLTFQDNSDDYKVWANGKGKDVEFFSQNGYITKNSL